ncbi:MAG: hypothetical protein WCO03_01960 [bacterium]
MKKYFKSLIIVVAAIFLSSTGMAQANTLQLNNLTPAQKQMMYRELDSMLADTLKIAEDLKKFELSSNDTLTNGTRVSDSVAPTTPTNSPRNIPTTGLSSFLSSDDNQNGTKVSSPSSLNNPTGAEGAGPDGSSPSGLSSLISSDDDQTNGTEVMCEAEGLTSCTKEAACRKALAEKVGFKNKGEESGLFNNSCPTTRASGLKESALSMLAYLRESCDKTMGGGKCRITITAGKERGHSASGAHPKGLGVDLSQKYPEFNNFIRVNKSRILQSTGCSCGYEGAGATANTTGSHWHCDCSAK